MLHTYNRHVSRQGDRNLPTIYFDSVKPTQSSKFLIHVLLSMGRYETEAQLLSHSNMQECFTHAELFDPKSPEESVTKLTKRYVEEQLIHFPGGTTTFDKHLIAAYQTLQDRLLRNKLHIRDMPPFLYTKLQKKGLERLH